MTTPVTASMLYDLVSCPHRVTMDLFADPAQRDEPNPFVKLLWERGSVYEREVIEGLEIRRPPARTGASPGPGRDSPACHPRHTGRRSLWMSLLGLGADGAAFKDLAVGHQVAQTLDGLRPDVDMEVLDVLDHHLRGCGSWGRRGASSGISAEPDRA